MNGEYIAKARTLDHEHSRQADGTRYTQACVSRCRVTYLGVGDLHARTTDVHRRWGSVFLLSGGRGRASSAAACPSLLWAAERRHPSPRPAARVRARPR